MHWTQVIDPFKNIGLSAFVAALPVFFIFWALIVKKMKGYQASLLAIVMAILIALIMYKMPPGLALLSTLYGSFYGLFPICWIVVSAVFLFNLSVKSGQFEVIRHFMASISPDRRLQALLIAFSFGAFLEGTAGFGAPVAITVAVLVGLGFNPFYASCLCLIANTAPVAFGAIGVPITAAALVTHIPEMTISKMVGRILPFLSMLIPFYLVILMSGWKKAMEVLPAIVVSGFSFAILQWLVSNFLGPALPDVIAGISSILCLIILLKFWKPKNIWRFPNEPAASQDTEKKYSSSQLLRAWSPFIVLSIMILAWGIGPVKNWLNSIGQVQFEFPGLHKMIIDQSGKPIDRIFKLNYLSASGTAVLLSSIISIPLIGLNLSQAIRVFIETIKQLRFPIITIATLLAFAYIVNDSGMTITIARLLANTGVLFPFFAPVLGWLGVFMTGSDTSANTLFAKLQQTTAASIGVAPVLTVSANAAGGVIGKMISPQSIAVAAASGKMRGRESELFRFTFKHSLIMLLLICIIVMCQAYLFKWMIPH